MKPKYLSYTKSSSKSYQIKKGPGKIIIYKKVPKFKNGFDEIGLISLNIGAIKYTNDDKVLREQFAKLRAKASAVGGDAIILRNIGLGDVIEGVVIRKKK